MELVVEQDCAVGELTLMCFSDLRMQVLQCLTVTVHTFVIM